MKFDFKPLVLAALAASFACAAGAQQAPLAPPMTEGAAQQPQQQQQQQAQPSQDRGMRGADPAARTDRRVQHMQVRIAQHLAGLKVKLNLTPAQQNAWDAFSSSVTPTREQLLRMTEMRQEMRSMTTPERIDRMRALRAERSAAMDQRFDATKRFYAHLSPEQQKTFDANALPRHGRHHGGRHHGGGHEMGHAGDAERHGNN